MLQVLSALYCRYYQHHAAGAMGFKSLVKLFAPMCYILAMDDFKTAYHNALCKDVPSFIEEYAALPLLQRLEGIGLLCGTDWTPIFSNKFYYSRLDHSIGTALITWNFTHDKIQTIASLLHDVSTPAFSHVSDFKNGDALTQSSTEDLNSKMIDEDAALQALLKRDGIKTEQVNNYHLYPVCDNIIPTLSADRLEYMYPSGAALEGIWSIEDAIKNYSHIKVLTNERNQPELGFDNAEEAHTYAKKFLKTSLILQKNRDKVAMQLMADVLTEAEKEHIITGADLYKLSEQELIQKFEDHAKQKPELMFSALFRTFRGAKSIIQSNNPLKDIYCINIKVKRRFVDPLTETENGVTRVSKVYAEYRKAIWDFLNFEDSPYAGVELL